MSACTNPLAVPGAPGVRAVKLNEPLPFATTSPADSVSVMVYAAYADGTWAAIEKTALARHASAPTRMEPFMKSTDVAITRQSARQVRAVLQSLWRVARRKSM